MADIRWAHFYERLEISCNFQSFVQANLNINCLWEFRFKEPDLVEGKYYYFDFQVYKAKMYSLDDRNVSVY